MANLDRLMKSSMLLYPLTFNKVDLGNLNEKYAMKVANDYSYKQDSLCLRKLYFESERKNQKAQEKNQRRPSQAKSNVPKWSNPEYKNETSEETRLELERKKKKC